MCFVPQSTLVPATVTVVIERHGRTLATTPLQLTTTTMRQWRVEIDATSDSVLGKVRSATPEFVIGGDNTLHQIEVDTNGVCERRDGGRILG
jgi:hypothetical protein